MSLTASIELGASTLRCGQSTAAFCTVENDSAGDVSVTSITPTVLVGEVPSSSAPVTIGIVAPQGGRFPATVPGVGSKGFNFTVTAIGPTGSGGLADLGQYEFGIGAAIYSSGGVITEPEVAEVVVTDPYVQTTPD